ncbi:MAG: hypothetical protein QOF51_699 [Chloroflexota bacterium]|nr:hypothetical protein [Chloroflexota bacterium]
MAAIGVSPEIGHSHWPRLRVRSHWQQLIRPTLGVVAVVVLSVALALAPIDYRALGEYGYVGIFAVTLVATATFFLPVPYMAAIVIGGSFLDPILVALVAGVAATIGELSGYVVGATGRNLLPHNRAYVMVERAIARFGGPVIFLAAAIPNPVFDFIGIIAGATRLPLWVFALGCFSGKTVRFWIVASAGGAIFAWLTGGTIGSL